MSGAPALDERHDEEEVAGNRVRVALWGASREARNAYLGSLRLASERDHLPHRRWEVRGATPRAEAWMVEATRQLRAGILPDATVDDDTLSLCVREELPVARWRRQVTRGRQVTRADTTRSTAFHVCMPDRPGLDIADSAAARLVRTADGIVYLFDPELAGDQNQASFERLLQHIGPPPEAAPRSRRSPLALAVCVVNFDRPTAFQFAVDKLWLNQDESPPRMPLILDRDAEEYFRQLCRKVGADALPSTIRHSPLPRVEYSVGSAVGFHLDDNDQFRSSDPFNHTGPQDRLRGPARPINILEPLVRLATASHRRLIR